jgi:hypothetical protein
MRNNLLGFALITSFLLGKLALHAQEWTLDITALIDGRDQLIIQGNTLLWHHLDNAAVGRHEGLNEPTVITTTLDGQPLMDHINWIPAWPEPPPEEIRYEAFSSTFSLLTPGMPQIPTFTILEVIQARSALTLFQFPSAANDYTTVLDFDDNDLASHDTYQARLTFSTVPEPSVAGLVPMTFALYRLLKRRSRSRETLCGLQLTGRVWFPVPGYENMAA